jgi:tetratricopeptide (TPR) repeat protein
MKIPVTIAAIFLLGIGRLFAAPLDTLSIRGKVLKAPIYIQIANGYLHYDTITDEDKKLAYQKKAIKYTLLALHYYSRNIDSIGLRTCFNNLAKVYRSQKEYSQAKWFVLQSNAISRAKGDVLGTISSLIDLASIKMDIKDYALATKDLDEALALATKHHFSRAESAVDLRYALLYNQMNNYDKADVALKRHDAINDSIHKREEAILAAKLKADEAFENKKKIYTANNIKLYNNLYFKRIASL